MKLKAILIFTSILFSSLLFASEWRSPLSYTQACEKYPESVERIGGTHVVGYTSEIEGIGGRWPSEAVIFWFKNHSGANPYAGRSDVAYKVVNLGSGRIGSATVFEADIDYYRVYPERTVCQ